MIADDSGEFLCPVTGKVWQTRPEWLFVGPLSTNRIYVLDGRIVMCRSFGSSKKEIVEWYSLVMRRIIEEFYVPGRPLVLIEDYTHLHESDNAGRQAYIGFHLARQDIWKGVIYFGMNSLFKLFFRLASRLYPLTMSVELLANYTQSIQRAYQLLGMPLEAGVVPGATRPRSWQSEDITVDFYPLDRENVLRIAPKGRMLTRDVPDLVRAFEEFLATQSPPPGQWYRLIDYSGLVDWEYRALFHVLRMMRRIDILFPPRKRFIVAPPTGLVPSLVIAWLDWTGKSIAMRNAMEIPAYVAWLNELELHRIRPTSLLSRIRDFFERSRSRTARDLMAFISELQWDGAGVPRNPYLESDPMHQVAASLLVVKTDFDALFVERDRRERELDAARRKAEEVNRLQARFLANVSHEIRTPLSAVIGMGDLLTDTDLDPRQQDLLRTLRQSAQGLLAVINDILDLSRMEAGEFHLVDEPFRLESVLGEVGSMIGYLASTKGIGFRMQRASELPVGLRGDTLRLRQILVNLAGNAVKFTEEGEVVVRVASGAAVEPACCRLVIEVEDSGPGIPTGKIEELFLPFKQLDGSFTRRHGGTGLGLAIARNLAERMGGGISVHPAPARGSIFRFEADFPLAEPPPQSEASVESEEGRLEGRILIAEDNPVNRKVVMGLLVKLGLEPMAVENGREAIETLARHPGAFRCVLMDIQMPVMDGLEAVRRIRVGEAGEMVRTIPILALTAHAMDGDREQFLSAGMDGYLSKPIRFSHLRSSLESLLCKGPTRIF